MSLPAPFPPPLLPPFAFDVGAFFRSVEARIAWMRQYRKMPALVGGLLVGQENLSKQLAAPALCVVPRGLRYEPARNTRDVATDLVPQLFWSSWMRLEAHCWGDDDPEARDELYAFSSALDISRQFLVSVQAENGGVLRTAAIGSEWVQKTDVNRLGRMLVAMVDIEVWVTDDPPILMPGATTTTPGVQAHVVVDVTSPDGTSTIQGAEFYVP